jgi:Protein of unknown function (DUF2516)
MLLYGFDQVMFWLSIAVFLLKAAAFIDAAIRPKQAYVAADKQTKPFWLLILGITAFADLIGFGNFLGLISIIGVIAALVYFIDVRPALKQVGGGRSSSGPYGPW